ncbi:MAG: NAD-dependent epimerase/dehydratase family protein [Planctomycetota bacterium]
MKSPARSAVRPRPAVSREVRAATPREPTGADVEPLDVLVTGGAGFIGSHLCDELLTAGHRVRVLDCLSPQVHSPETRTLGRPAYLDDRVDVHVGDVCDREAVDEAVEPADVVVHFAAAVGVGQSMYDVARYTQTNALGTATLMESVVARHRRRPLKRLLVASSMSVYGEGRYRDANGSVHDHASRDIDALRSRLWEPVDDDGHALEPIATPEEKCPELSSIYALGKFDQERMSLLLGSAAGLPTVAMRFFNAYGPRQSLGNPYTGVLAIFAGRLLGGEAPMIYEDGRQRRDLVHVTDVARCCRLAIEADATLVAGEVINVGSGEDRTVLDVARDLAATVDRAEVEPEIAGKYRVGDIRHCFADIAKARRLLGFEPEVAWTDGIRELALWLDSQRHATETTAAPARIRAAHDELTRHGLAV